MPLFKFGFSAKLEKQKTLHKILFSKWSPFQAKICPEHEQQLYIAKKKQR